MADYIFDGTVTSYFSDETPTAVLLNSIVQQSWVVRVKRTINDVDHGIIGCVNAVSRLKLSVAIDNNMDGSLRDTGTSSFINGVVSSDGAWYIYTMTYDGISIDLYQDKVRVVNQADPDFIARLDGRILSIGATALANIGFETYLTGEMSDVQFYNRALIQAEIDALVDDLTDLPTDNATSLVANFSGQKTQTTWTSDVGGFELTNAGGVQLPSTTTTVEIEWIDSVSVAVIGHKVYRDTVPSTGEVELADLGLGVQYYADDTALTGTEYKYEVQGYSSTFETISEQITVNVRTITTAS